MAEKYTVEQLNKLNKKDLMLLVLSMQDQLTPVSYTHLDVYKRQPISYVHCS